MKAELLNLNEPVPSATICTLLGIKKSVLPDYREKGLPTIGEGPAMRYPLASCIKWYIGHQTSKEVAKVKAQHAPVEMDKDEAVVRKLTAEALIKEVELESLRGTLVHFKDAEAELAKHMTIVRSGLLSFPARVSPYIVGLRTELEAREMIMTKIHELMTQLAKQAEDMETIDEELDEDDDLEE